jgi:hypothetical protein
MMRVRWLAAADEARLLLDSVLPRHMGSGLCRYHEMIGYTSVGVGSSIVPVFGSTVRRKLPSTTFDAPERLFQRRRATPPVWPTQNWLQFARSTAEKSR